MKYDFNRIERDWQKYWADNQTFKADNTSDKPKYYVLDMFPYPSGAGLHVGHPLGYIASDIYARYKRHKGFNVLHPQGYDSFGLPAEQYAIQTGQHPALTTEENIKTYRRQLDQIGFSFDWSREVRTSDPNYYKWTQWIFIQLFESWYNNNSNKAESIDTLITKFASEGNANVNAVCDDDIELFSAEAWNSFSSVQQQEILLKYRLTYLAETEVNWCPALGTVLANDEIVNGVSERGGHPVIRKKMTQWSMRISAYAERLLQGLNDIDWTDALKESQRNWIGKSVGAMVSFRVLSPTLTEVERADKGYLTGNSDNAHLLLERAKEMRANPTQAETMLWQSLKGKKLESKFRQQHLIGDYIVDFVCLEKKLIIEVDGPIHDFQKEEDDNRTFNLEVKGYKVIRFKNEEVIGNIDDVIHRIQHELNNRPSLSESKVLPSGKDLGWDSGKDLGWDSENDLEWDSENDLAREISVFTTRPDTIFGVSFMTLAPEHELVAHITTDAQKAEVEAYIEKTAKRSERDRMADVKTISGVFTGAYAEHPFTKEPIPIWIGDYVLAGYGTGAVMSVPCGDERDYAFAKYFNIPIPNIFEGVDISEAAFSDKEKTVITNSDFLNGLGYKEATKKAIEALEALGQGKGKTNYRLRDAVFSRQRYWGEPFPVYYVEGMPQMIDAKHLPIKLPEVEKYLPTETGEPPLGNANVWAWDTERNEVVANTKINHTTVFPLELNTMPGWAGSSWYWMRYMDAHNTSEFAGKEALDYWENVDLYIGGSEHATGHLLYSRFWNKFLKDRGYAPTEEPFKKLINQGMILGESAFAYRIGISFTFQGEFSKEKTGIIAGFGALSYLSEKETDILRKLQEDYFFIKNDFYSDEIIKHLKGSSDTNIEVQNQIINIYLKKLQNDLRTFDMLDKVEIAFVPLVNKFKFYKTHVPVEFVNLKNELDENKFKNWQEEYKNSNFIVEQEGGFVVSREVEKMSKSKYNVVNPDQICIDYGADSLRLYEMFLGPLEQYKPWNTAGITGVHGFLKKLWKLYVGEHGINVNEAAPSKESLKTLHKTIKKVTEDIENFSFNTTVSTFMIAVNELTAQTCTSKEILEPLLILISPYAPHIAEELWAQLGNSTSISTALFPEFDAQYLVESTKEYPISFNGKMRFTMELPLDLSKEEIEATVLANEKTQEQLQGRTPKKVIVVPGKIVNIVG